MSIHADATTNVAVKLDAIVPEKAQIDALYKLLGKREHFISHRSLPAYEDHCRFVRNHPYREWYLIRLHNEYVGSIYVGTDNSIGLNNVESLELDVFETIVTMVMNSVKPLPAVASVRPDSFYFNVATTNQGLMKKLEAIGYSPVQVTYSAPL